MPTPSRSCWRPTVSFRALTPGRFWESDDADAVVDERDPGHVVPAGSLDHPDPQGRLRTIGTVDQIERVERVGYRFQAKLPDGDFIIEQQAYFQAENETITWLQILCSGFRP